MPFNERDGVVTDSKTTHFFVTLLNATCRIKAITRTNDRYRRPSVCGAASGALVDGAGDRSGAVRGAWQRWRHCLLQRHGHAKGTTTEHRRCQRSGEGTVHVAGDAFFCNSNMRSEQQSV